MCRRSPAADTMDTRTASEQLLEGVNAGRMPITPLDFDPIGTHQSNRGWTDVHRYGVWIQQRPSAHLFDAAGAGAGEAQLASRIKAFVPRLIPFDPEPVVLAIDGVREGGLHSNQLRGTLGARSGEL